MYQNYLCLCHRPTAGFPSSCREHGTQKPNADRDHCDPVMVMLKYMQELTAHVAQSIGRGLLVVELAPYSKPYHEFV